MPFRAALLQITSSDNPRENLALVCEMLREARLGGADIALTPEVTNCVSNSRLQQDLVLETEVDDASLKVLQLLCKELNLWLIIGSLALKTNAADGRFANRSIVINNSGVVLARYDKIHMFDVNVTDEETYRESDGYRPGQNAVVAETPFGRFGLSICYDVRFPYLYRALAMSGAEILTVPAAFSHVTGPAHWEVLVRSRAIENGCFVLAAAQTGQHKSIRGHDRRTHGHTMVVDPWGKVLVNAGKTVGVTLVDIDLALVNRARKMVPSLAHTQEFDGP